MASFEERIYELGSDALSEQERQVAEVRGRGPTLLAGGGVIASLLAEPVFNGAHPDGFSEIAATAIGLLGSSAVLLFVVLLLRPDELGFSVKAGATYRALWDQDILEQPMLDIALAEAFEVRSSADEGHTGALCGVAFGFPEPNCCPAAPKGVGTRVCRFRPL